MKNTTQQPLKLKWAGLVISFGITLTCPALSMSTAILFYEGTTLAKLCANE